MRQYLNISVPKDICKASPSVQKEERNEEDSEIRAGSQEDSERRCLRAESRESLEIRDLGIICTVADVVPTCENLEI